MREAEDGDVKRKIETEQDKKVLKKRLFILSIFCSSVFLGFSYLFSYLFLHFLSSIFLAFSPSLLSFNLDLFLKQEAETTRWRETNRGRENEREISSQMESLPACCSSV